jgi:hypothetical protein
MIYTPLPVEASKGAVCNGCGALVLQVDQPTHDRFHVALADLFDDFAELRVRVAEGE